MTAAPLLSLDSVRLAYGRRTVLDGVSLEVFAGEILGLVGPNGAGKTTLVRTVLGTLRPRAGAVRWARGCPERIGYMPQRERFDPVWPLSAHDFVLLGRAALRGPGRPFRAADRAAARSALERVGLAGLAHAPIADLSGGQVKRALLARALVADPAVLVLDEPTAGLDLAAEAAFLSLVSGLNREGLTVLLVSHDLNLVARVAHRIALLHDGRIREGPAEAMLSADVLGEVYGLDVRVGTVEGHRVVSARPRGDAR